MSEMETVFGRKAAIITGAGGGMGKACARRLATRYTLVLNDNREDGLAAIAASLVQDEGAEIAARIAGDLNDPAVLDALIDAATGRLGAVIHTAGRSPMGADWRTILETNLIASARLLDALESQLGPGLVAVLIASNGRFMVPPPPPAMIEAFDHPLAHDFLERMAPLLGNEDYTVRSAAYCYSKWWVHREVQRRATRWAAKGARIMSISPGMIFTPMGRLEVEEGVAGFLREGTPIPRWGTPGDIADTADFILSDKAGFLTGSDILVDGGVTARFLWDGMERPQG